MTKVFSSGDSPGIKNPAYHGLYHLEKRGLFMSNAKGISD